MAVQFRRCCSSPPLSQCGKEDVATPAPSALLSASDGSAPAQWRYVQPDTLNCRAGPTARSLSLRLLKRGESMGLVRTNGDWSQINGDLLCWAKSSYLKETPQRGRRCGPRVKTKPPPARAWQASFPTAEIKRQIIRDLIDN